MKGEIKIAGIHIETPLTLTENYVQLLIIENPAEFYKTVTSLLCIMEGGSGEFVFSRSGKEISAEKTGCMVSDLFVFTPNDKKILTLLYKKLTDSALSSVNLLTFNELNTKILQFIENITYQLPFDLNYAELHPADCFKAVGLKFNEENESLLEKIICYINLSVELRETEFFVFVNLKSVLGDKDLRALYKHCRLEKVGLLIVENSKVRSLLENEHAVIITDDLCEIVENY